MIWTDSRFSQRWTRLAAWPGDGEIAFFSYWFCVLERNMRSFPGNLDGVTLHFEFKGISGSGLYAQQ